jgi:hypothetical protein
MNEAQLRRAINSVGMRVFVEYFALFSDPGLTAGGVADRLPAAYTRKARATRASKGRGIITAGAGREALAIIAASRRAGPQVSERARALLAES